MTIGSLFSGVGGLDLGLERAGLGPVVWQAENDPYCLAVLEKHWPNVTRYTDVRAVDATAVRPDIICGGFPCPPVSVAGKQKAQADPRWLWPEFARILRDLRPRYVVVENVPGLLTANDGSAFGDVLGSLAALGYDAQWRRIGACDVGAPHRRHRIFIVAHCDESGLEGRSLPGRGRTDECVVGTSGGEVADAGCGSLNAQQPVLLDRSGSAPAVGEEGPNLEHSASGGLGMLRGAPGKGNHGDVDGAEQNVADAAGPRREWAGSTTHEGRPGSGDGSSHDWPPGPDDADGWRDYLTRYPDRAPAIPRAEPGLRRGADGIPKWMDARRRRARLKCLGNAVVVQVAEEVGRWLLDIDASLGRP